MKKILFLHGFFASGQCIPAKALREALQHEADVLSPDLPLSPQQAMTDILEYCASFHPDVLVGNSCGAFYAQMASAETGIPALLGNPYFMMTQFLGERLGKHQYKSPRANGQQDFIIDESLIRKFGEMEQRQFDHVRSLGDAPVWGLFGENDTLAHFEPLFLKYYSQSYHFPGGHTPTDAEVRQWYAPLVLQLLRLTSHT